MRVLFWSLTFWPAIGGMEVLAARLLPSLRARGHELLVLAPKIYEGPDEGELDGIPIRWLPFQSTVTPGIEHLARVRGAVIALKRQFAPELVHLNGAGHMNFFHLATRHVSATPTLATLHGEWLAQADGIVAQTLRSADWVAACSHAVLERGLHVAPEIAARCSVIHNGIDLSAPPLAAAPPADARLLFLGRLAHEKGADIALAALPRILERFPAVRLTLAGDGPDRPALEQQAARAGIAHAVDFIGWVQPKDTDALISAHTIVLLPSRQDSFPLTALEAARMARPIVASRVGGVPELVADGETGVLVEPESSDALAAAVTHLLLDRGALERLAHAARRRAERLFGWEQHVTAYDDLYKRIASGDARERRA